MFRSFLILLTLFVVSCTASEEPKDKNLLYLGEKHPGSRPVVFGKDIISVNGRFDMGITISPDGRYIVFGVADPSAPDATNLYLLRAEDGTWTQPEKSFLPENVNTFFPMFGPNGEKFYFAKSQGQAATNLWMADFKNGEVSNLSPLDTVINSNTREAGHGITRNGMLYFTSNRDESFPCCGDIYRSVPGSHKIEKLQHLNSDADEESLYLSPEEDFIVIQAWKQEHESKHDLYIAYRQKNGAWTSPERLNNLINTTEIEQRPFVSADKKFLFFSRMSITNVDGEDLYDSDIFWVSTASIFEPYVFNAEFEAKVEYEEEFNIQIPGDLFRDIDDHELSFSLTLENGTPFSDSVQFDSIALTLKGLWPYNTSKRLKLIALDKAGNQGEYTWTMHLKK